MKVTITTEDLLEVIHEKEYPENFKSDHGVIEANIRTSIKGASANVKEAFFDGISIINGRYSFKDQFVIQGGFDSPILEMHFNLLGRTGGTISDYSGEYFLEQNEHNLFYMTEPKGVFKFEENTNVETLEISFTPDYFKKFANTDCKIIDSYLEAIENQRPLCMVGNGQMNPLMKSAIQQIVNCPYQGAIRRIMLEAKILELFAYQVESFEQMQSTNCECTYVEKSELEKLRFAKEIIETRLDTPPTIYELSKMIGLNEFKLKKGFKKQFGNTVFGYISDYRLSIAKQFILETARPLSEISDMIGYSHQQHFSTAFKRKYGVVPSDLRR